MRTLAIGDVHGALAALETLLEKIDLRPDDRLVTLGDYVDRGPDSRGVLDLMIALHAKGNLTPLRGNHELMMLNARRRHDARRFWLSVGGKEALESYATDGGGPDIRLVPDSHWEFMEKTCQDWCESDKYIFVHACVDADRPMSEQVTEDLHWGHLDWAAPHVSGKVVVCGHSEQRGGLPRYLGHTVGIDTWAYHADGWLTCLDVHTGRYWQANQRRETRAGWLNEPE